MCTVAVVERFGACVVDTVILPLKSWTDPVAFWTGDARKRSSIRKRSNFSYAVQWKAQKCWRVPVSSLNDTAVDVSKNNEKCYENTRQR